MYEILIPSANRFHFPKFRALYMLSIFRNWGLKAIITAMINSISAKDFKYNLYAGVYMIFKSLELGIFCFFSLYIIC